MSPTRRTAVLVSSGLHIGYLPKAPGTWASAAALPFAWAIHAAAGGRWLAGAALLAFLAGWWAASRIVRSDHVSDPGWIVMDEIAAQWLVCATASLSVWSYAMAFCLFRIFDIAKPWPVSWADRNIKGGFGVMFDDLLAALYAIAALAAVTDWIEPWVVRFLWP